MAERLLQICTATITLTCATSVSEIGIELVSVSILVVERPARESRSVAAGGPVRLAPPRDRRRRRRRRSVGG